MNEEEMQLTNAGGLAEKALQITSQNGNNVAVSTYIPYAIDFDTGELVNSFVYASMVTESGEVSPRNTQEISSQFVDVVVRTTAYYAKLSDSLGTIYYYRHAGLESAWTGSSGPFQMTRLYASYITKGDLKAYPDCVNQVSSPVLQYDYSIESLINQANPTMGTVYLDGNHTMPYNRAVHMADYYEDGGFVYVKVNYYNRSTGQSKSAEKTYKIYGK